MPEITIGVACYWRFIGDKEWRRGWPYREEKGLIRMGLYNGDREGGALVEPKEIEVR